MGVASTVEGFCCSSQAGIDLLEIREFGLTSEIMPQTRQIAFESERK
jgi:hypothetical protein